MRTIRQLPRAAKILLTAAVLAVASLGGLLLAGSASAARSIVASPGNPVYYLCHNDKSGSVTTVRRYDGTGTYPSCGSGYSIYYWSQQGPKGDTGAPGNPGQDATLTVSASTALSDHSDNGLHGVWAKDAMTRAVTVTRQHAAPASKCGSQASQCWFYTGTLTDNGSFRTVAAAQSPNTGTTISGVVAGTFTGAAKVEFYASSDTPKAALVPATVAGDEPSTSAWAKQLFAADTAFAEINLPEYAWTYSAPGTCEVFSESLHGAGAETDTGDIAGVNHCGG